MTIILYNNSSEPNRVYKNLTETATLEGTLKSETSALDPTILIEASASVISNYFYIKEFRRYYFITDIVSVKTGLWAITGHVDVLTTYANNIKNLNAIIARQEKQYNLYINDDRFLIDAPRQYWTKAFPNRVPTGGSSLVLTLAGGAKSESES